MSGMGSHHSAHAGTHIWITPRQYVEALGPFDLDPCASDPRPWDTAAEHYTDFGLLIPWHGRVWLNPPYGNHVGKWMNRMSGHGNGIALTFARTETEWFFEYVWYHATALFFLRNRITFCCVDGTPAGTTTGYVSLMGA